MSKLVEEVAKAICEACEDKWDAENFNQTGDGSEPDENREHYRHLARAAVSLVLARAAEVASDKCLDHVYEWEPGFGRTDIAAAIKALEEKE